MNRVDFYILDSSSSHAIIQFAIKLTEQLYRRKQRIHVHVDDPTTLRSLDDGLWLQRDASFVPHVVATAPQADCPVTLGMGEFTSDNEVLINLAAQMPEFAQQFTRVVEIINKQDTSVALARSRYRAYRARGYEIVNHKIEV